MLVQTFGPDNQAILAATRHDYERFVGHELPQRLEYGYPPYGKLVRIVVRSESEDLARETTVQIASCVNKFSDELGVEIRVLGPAKATVEKLRGKYRFHLLIRCDLNANIQSVLQRVQQQVKTVDGVQWIIDIDPQDML